MNEFFQPVYDLVSTLPSRLRPAVNNELICFASDRNGFEAYIRRDVLEAIAHAAHKAKPHETIGLLAGRAWHDDRGEYAVVVAMEGAQKNEIDAGPSHVRISAAGNARVRVRLEEAQIALDVIGWYHSHPRFPPEFSSTDFEEQTTWKDSNSIGIVYSGLPVSEPLRAFGVYQGPNAQKLYRQTKTLPPKPVTRVTEHQDANGGEAASLTPALEQGQGNAQKVLPDLMRTNLLRWPVAFGVTVLLVGNLWIGYHTQRTERQIVRLLDDISERMLHRGSTDGSEPSGTSKNGSAGGQPQTETTQDSSTQQQYQGRFQSRTTQAKSQRSPRKGGKKPGEPDTSANKKKSIDTANRPGAKSDRGLPKPQNSPPT